jgi:hypothetical protein
MGAFPEFDRQKARGFVSALCCGLLAASLALASGAYAAGGGGGGGGAGSGGGTLNQAEPRAEVRFANPARSGEASFGAATSCRTPR